jgi:Flp pilus assembly protein TadG
MTRNRAIRPSRFRRGATVLEAALVIPILLSLAFGAVEVGYFMFIKHTLHGAARVGARVGSLPGSTNGEVTTAVSNAMNAAGIPNGDYTLQIRNADTNANLALSSTAAETPVKVTVSCTWGDVAEGLRPMGVISASKVTGASVVMIKE